MRFVLASASPTRLRVLRDAGFDPEVVVSGVDEDVTGTAEQRVRELAYVKATTVAASEPDALVLGCDSLVEHGGEILGKPASKNQATEWWRRFACSTATVWTAQYLTLGGRGYLHWGSAAVTFTHVSAGEIKAYVATGEPLGAAGGFKLDGRASAFIDSVDGHPGVVHGVSVPWLNDSLRQLRIRIGDLWV
jgi:septum formation protein